MSANPGTVVSTGNVELLPADQKWLDAQNFSVVPTMRKPDGVIWLNERLGTPFKNNAVFRAYESGEIPTALVSGAALASEYDLAAWALAKKYRHLTQAG
ncbi:hypothetical protein [Mycobacteroides abscessus]|jgi:hypothetical protein|uniref:hypothetical protein n=1 Tax=Mycobacteroides abscessus TaxID=36809 RepID=UPI000FD7CD8B|nr:hypothetical protein [Mycobacteroides abscessus]MBN7329597.1 hypothetical protein [Mycobacteroides abscessus subsp. abscessus]MBN7334501.1 hypothetical protein [Mycobacteroides abscessus subsp. abscessus]MDM2236874.1 hypothetical protein [Mycobacteroides abscessus]MDM2245752.1 hypothetical protein [Mycobacteroides abscessus]MDM2254430.1 hypothetical protein [Mycobacteroides abscessus]